MKSLAWCVLLVAACGTTEPNSDDGDSGGGKADGADSDPDSNRNRTCAGGCDEDSVCDADLAVCIPEPGAPTLRSPISGARTSGLPAVSWNTASAADDSVIKICEDIACLHEAARVTGSSSATLPAALPRGVYFVRGYGRSQQAGNRFVTGAVHTPTRVIFANGTAAPTSQPLGLSSDFDRDGKVDLFRAIEAPSSSGSTMDLTMLFGTGTRQFVRGGWTTCCAGADTSDYSFGTLAIPVLDLDGDGRTEVVTVEKVRVSTNNTTVWVNPVKVQRYQLDAMNKLALASSVEVAFAPGQSVGKLISLGDIDRDGYADVGVELRLPHRLTTPQFGGTLAYRTGVELVILRGSAQGLVPGSRIRFEIPEPEQSSYDPAPTLTAVGDVNRDGFSDLALSVNAPDADDRTVSWHRLHVDIYAGAAQAPYQTVLARIPRITAPTALGDIDGDGFADVGGIQHNGFTFANHQLSAIDPARVVVLQGGTGALASTVAWTMPVIDLPGCSNGSSPFYSKFPQDGVLIGGGDLDGDGRDDVAIGSVSSHDGTGTSFHRCEDTGGRVRTLYGSTLGLAGAPAQTIVSPAGANRYFPTEARFIGNFGPTTVGDELLLGTDSYRASPTDPYEPARKDMFGGSHGSLAAMRRF